MEFWIICTLLTCAVAAAMIMPMLRPPPSVGEDPQVALYKAQLAEVDRDVAREVVAAEDAERTKAEIARRLLAASSSTATTTDSTLTRPAVLALVVIVLGLSGATYWQLGAPGYGDLPLQTRIALGNEARANRPAQDVAAAAAPIVPQPDVPEDYLETVAQLRQVVPLRGDDLQGWELLSFHETQLFNYAAASEAQARVIEIKGDDATVDDKTRLADLMVAAANGYVSPEAEKIVREVLAVAPNNIPARYYLGAMFNQTDRPDRALQLWRSILESGAAESFHSRLARDQVGDAAFRAGTSYTPPPVEEMSLEQAMSGEGMTEDEQSQMISGMVGRLADRLATQGGPVTDWARLIIAYGVLGATEDASAILAEARDTFGASDEALEILDEAARRAGLAE